MADGLADKCIQILDKLENAAGFICPEFHLDLDQEHLPNLPVGEASADYPEHVRDQAKKARRKLKE
jgi:hypothetical protein